MAYAIGHVSGCHLNPAVSVGLLVGKRFPASELVPYVIAQVLGGIAGAAVLYFIASGQDGFQAGGFASNGSRSPGAPGHRPVPHVDPLDRHSGRQPLGQSGTQHCNRDLRRALGSSAALAVLGRTDHRRRDWRRGLPTGCRQRRLKATPRTPIRISARQSQWRHAPGLTCLVIGKSAQRRPHRASPL